MGVYVIVGDNVYELTYVVVDVWTSVFKDVNDCENVIELDNVWVYDWLNVLDEVTVGDNVWEFTIVIVYDGTFVNDSVCDWVATRSLDSIPEYE